MKIDKMIEVLTAAKAGKPLQTLRDGADGIPRWHDEIPGMYPHCIGEWRVKPQPREWWVNTNHLWALDKTPEEARSRSSHEGSYTLIKVREVLE